jgi:hypothetical protein
MTRGALSCLLVVAATACISSRGGPLDAAAPPSERQPAADGGQEPDSLAPPDVPDGAALLDGTPVPHADGSDIPADGSGSPMDASDGLDSVPDVPSAETASDGSGGGAPPPVDVSLADEGAPPDPTLFHDDFESGDLARWTGHSGTASVTGDCALSGGHGLRIDADPSTNVWFDLPSPQAAVRISARVDARTLVSDPRVIGSNALVVLRNADIPIVADIGLSVASPSPSKVHADVFRVGGGLRQIHNDNPFTPAPHVLQLEWRGSSALGVADGLIRLAVDGQPGIFEPDLADGEKTIAVAISRLSLGFVYTGGAGFVCVDDVTLTSLPP